MTDVNRQERDAWVRSVEALAGQVEGWAARRGWVVRRETIELTEDGLGRYSVPVLMVDAPAGQIVLEPVAGRAAGCDGRIDVSAYPSLNRLLLKRSGDQWRLETEAGVRWPQPWSEDTFEYLARELSAAA